MKITFVGAGPGAADLVTVRGARALAEADAVMYAGSLVLVWEQLLGYVWAFWLGQGMADEMGSELVATLLLMKATPWEKKYSAVSRAAAKVVMRVCEKA